MVNAIKRWLGIDALVRENLQLAKALKSAHERITALNGKVDKIDTAMAGALNAASDTLEKSLTSEPAKPKLMATPQRVNWKSFRTAAERATESEREEA